MCGIAGIISKQKVNDLKESLNKMLETIIHRGPDGHGEQIFDNRIALGHRRLAILDLSKEGLQPMCYCSNLWITFNGEIYNYIELRDELKNYGFTFRTGTDTEVLLASYQRWGEDCVNHFNGMWSFAIYDVNEQKIFCSRDRYGVKPFYYSVDKNRFVFASEIKELLAISKDRPKADIDRLKAYLATGIQECGYTTMFRGILQLEGGCNLILNCKTLEYNVYRWYELSEVSLNRNTKEQNYRDFKTEFFSSVRLRLRADVPVGSCLSGGMDSSAIVCAVHENMRNSNMEKEQITISSCFKDKRYDEQEYIDAVVKHTGVTSYKVFPDMSKVFDELDDLIWHMDEPFGGTSVYAQWCVFKKAREHGLTVMLDGQGADEQLAGYTPFYQVLFIDLLKKGKWQRLKKEIQYYKAMRASSENISTKRIILSTFASVLFADRFRYSINKLYRKNVMGMPYTDDFYDNKYVKKGYQIYDKRNPQKYIQASMLNGLSALLHYEDRNSMAHSIESRVPFLDYKLVELIYSVPIDQKIENGKTKNILREGLKDILPKEVYDRYTKLGFVTPEDQWLKDNEKFFYHELEKACDRLETIVNKESVLTWYKAHIQKVQRGDSTCFRLICAAHWANIYNVEVSV